MVCLNDFDTRQGRLTLEELNNNADLIRILLASVSGQPLNRLGSHLEWLLINNFLEEDFYLNL